MKFNRNGTMHPVPALPPSRSVTLLGGHSNPMARRHRTKPALGNLIALLFGISAPLAICADPPPLAPQPQPSFTEVAPGAWKLDWNGVVRRTYFIQTSLDLVTWFYQPVMAFGDGIWTIPGLGSSSPKYFVRLIYADEGWVGTLQEARDADFDNDGIPNYYEVEVVGSDPFDKNSAGGDSNTNGLPDGWEMFHFGGLGIADPNAILQPDGLTNKEKAELGLKPDTDYSSPSATQPAKFDYDLTGRLTGVTAPVGAGTYTPDDEGNLLNAQ